MRDAVQHIAAARLLLEAGLRPILLARPERGQPPCVVGPVAGGRAFGFGLPFGQADAQSLRHLADIAGPCMVIRPTPWRALLLCDIPEGADLPVLPDFITDPTDPRLGITACVGRPACARASVDARADAAFLARALPGIRAHVSGCTKGCAHPAPSGITLAGRDGCYDLIRNGRATDTPVARGLTIGQAMALLRQTAKEAAA
jgi:precorrin-3B synthase